MFKHYFELIQGVEIWPVISLVLFFAFFSVTLIRVLTTDKKHIEKMESLPFEKDELEEQTSIDNA